MLSRMSIYTLGYIIILKRYKQTWMQFIMRLYNKDRDGHRRPGSFKCCNALIVSKSIRHIIAYGTSSESSHNGISEPVFFITEGAIEEHSYRPNETP